MVLNDDNYYTVPHVAASASTGPGEYGDPAAVGGGGGDGTYDVSSAKGGDPRHLSPQPLATAAAYDAADSDAGAGNYEVFNDVSVDHYEPINQDAHAANAHQHHVYEYVPHPSRADAHGQHPSRTFAVQQPLCSRVTAS